MQIYKRHSIHGNRKKSDIVGVSPTLFVLIMALAFLTLVMLFLRRSIIFLNKGDGRGQFKMILYNYLRM